MKKPSVSQNLALKAAAAARSYDDEVPSTPSYDDLPSPRSASDEMEATPSADDLAPPRPSDPDFEKKGQAEHGAAQARARHETQWAEEDVDPAPGGRGRPRGKRDVKARQTIYLDAARHAALARLSAANGRSVHSLIIEGIDRVTGKPPITGYD